MARPRKYGERLRAAESPRSYVVVGRPKKLPGGQPWWEGARFAVVEEETGRVVVQSANSTWVRHLAKTFNEEGEV